MLRHSSDNEPGYTRKKRGKGWEYFDEQGVKLADKAEIQRLNSLALPPAYVDTWFCKDGDAHILATGMDAKGRKQYRYHPDYRALQDAVKYDGCREFGEALPKLRKQVAKDLRRRKLVREAVVAAVVRLLDTQYFRIGNERYAKLNKSFGLTTLRGHHLHALGSRLMMRFRAKSGVIRKVVLRDPSIKRIVMACQDLPGQKLFRYVNRRGDASDLTSADVNDYIREVTGSDYTAKHFRTWGASVIFFDQLLNKPPGKLDLNSALEPVAEALGNTPTISRQSYVHPCLIEALQEDKENPLGDFERPRARKHLSAAETGLLKFLDERPMRVERHAQDKARAA